MTFSIIPCIIFYFSSHIYSYQYQMKIDRDQEDNTYTQGADDNQNFNDLLENFLKEITPQTQIFLLFKELRNCLEEFVKELVDAGIGFVVSGGPMYNILTQTHTITHLPNHIQDEQIHYTLSNQYKTMNILTQTHTITHLPNHNNMCWHKL